MNISHVTPTWELCVPMTSIMFVKAFQTLERLLEGNPGRDMLLEVIQQNKQSEAE